MKPNVLQTTLFAICVYMTIDNGESICRDNVACGWYVTKGWCRRNHFMFRSVSQLCRKSCGLCREKAVSSSACSDRTQFYCSSYKIYGYCYTNRHFMMQNCKKTCGFCSSRKTVRVCKDTHKSCAHWASYGECNRNPRFMHVQCRKSCRLCGMSGCKDNDGRCSQWAQNGECTRNPRYMHKQCRRSCKLCGTKPKPTTKPQIKTTQTKTTGQPTPSIPSGQPPVEPKSPPFPTGTPVMPPIPTDETIQPPFPTNEPETPPIPSEKPLETPPLPTKQPPVEPPKPETPPIPSERPVVKPPKPTDKPATPPVPTEQPPVEPPKPNGKTETPPIDTKGPLPVVNTLPPLSSLVNGDGCGLSSAPPIVGGKLTKRGQWPWMVAVVKSKTPNKIHCGASLLSDRWVLCAAHCFLSVSGNDPSPYLAKVGEFDLTKDDNETVVKIEKIIKHEKFSPSTKDYDIALLKLAKPVKFSRNVRPVCVFSKMANSDCTVAGWGDNKNPEKEVDILQAVKLPIIDKAECGLIFKPLNIKLTKRMMCAGHKEGGKDACTGDSGGPLMCQAKDGGPWHQIGVVSWGMDCAKKNMVGVYTDLLEVQDWIDGKMSPTTFIP